MNSSHVFLDVVETLLVSKHKKPVNDAGWRFYYANPIVVMLCEAFKMSIQMKEIDKPGNV